MDKYRIDNHKLIFHVPRVNDWLKGENVYPIYMEISPSGSCNHRCTYCGLDFMEYQNRKLETPVLKERLSELGNLGLKSVMYAGEGEPFLHKDTGDIITHTKKSGIDVAITTNGVLLKQPLAEEILESVSWIKVSINGATEETYAKIHDTKPVDFNMVMENMANAVKLREEKGLNCSFGMQLLLLPDNHHEAELLAKKACDIGMDYLVIKPYSQHISSVTSKYSEIKYSDYFHLADKLEGYNSETFKVIFRINAMKKWDEKDKTYDCCQALPFWSYIDAGGNVWGCSVFLENKNFFYGNIYEESFQEIWEGELRQKSMKWFLEEFDIGQCRTNCRMDEINRYLWELKNPMEHVNFI